MSDVIGDARAEAERAYFTDENDDTAWDSMLNAHARSLLTALRKQAPIAREWIDPLLAELGESTKANSSAAESGLAEGVRTYAERFEERMDIRESIDAEDESANSSAAGGDSQ